MTSTAATTNETAPVDIVTMRETVGRFLPHDADQPTGVELAELVDMMRGQLELIIPEVHATAVSLPKTDIPRYCALACVGEAHARLNSKPLPGLDGPAIYARLLARTLNALADHYVNLPVRH
jgi:hypothetical protein